MFEVEVVVPELVLQYGLQQSARIDKCAFRDIGHVEIADIYNHVLIRIARLGGWISSA
ncbi:hypothetical protein D3C84_711560 [compost metagenome]